MNYIFFYVLIGIIFLILGFVIGKLFTKSTFDKTISELETRNKLLLEEKDTNLNIVNTLNEEKIALNNEKHLIDLRLTEKISELKNLEEKLQENKADVEKLQEKFSKDFEILANKILEEKSTKFTEQNRENIKNILNP